MRIYDDRPIPVKARGKTEYYRNLIMSLTIGQSFDAPRTDTHCIRSISLYDGVQITTRKNGEYLSVWRIS